MANIIKTRRDTAANWTSTDPTMADGEMGFESDTNRFKIGDGATAWTSLAYVHPSATMCELVPQAVTHPYSTTIVIPWTEVVDTDEYFSAVNDTRLIAPWTGLYYIEYTIVYTLNTQALSIQSTVNKNRAGATTFFDDIKICRNNAFYREQVNGGDSFSSAGYVELVAGEYLEVIAFHSTITGSSDRELSATKGGAFFKFIGLT
jgi:hypothetical protein